MQCIVYSSSRENPVPSEYGFEAAGKNRLPLLAGIALRSAALLAKAGEGEG